MDVYYDTGVLLPLYVSEAFSDAMLTFVEARGAVVSVNLLHLTEMESALRLKRFRGEIQNARLVAILAARDEDLRLGRLVARPVNWVQAFEGACRWGARVTEQWGCRTLDLLHVAVAVQWECAMFVTADGRQAQAARAAKLDVVDVRQLGPNGQPGGATGASHPRAARETQAQYGREGRRQRAHG